MTTAAQAQAVWREQNVMDGRSDFACGQIGDMSRFLKVEGISAS